MSRKDFKYRGTRCINCETALDVSEQYCHHCGQLNSIKKLTISDFIEEFFANFYAYDSRLRNSIISIFTKPGVLAREYNQGKRHKYANPFRFFLSVSIILFISFNLTRADRVNLTNADKQELAQKQFEDGIKKDSAAFKLAKINVSINAKQSEDKIVSSKDSIYTKDFIDAKINKNFDGIVYYITSMRNFHLKYPEKSNDQILKELGFENNFTYNTMCNKAKLFKSNNIYEELLEYFYQKLPFLIFLSLPILTLMFWLVFYSKKINYTEHLVFAYTFYTFMFLCMLLFNLIEVFSESFANNIALLSFTIIFPLYFYKSLRNFYQQTRWKTILKFVLLNPLFILLLSICVIVMMFLGILLF